MLVGDDELVLAVGARSFLDQGVCGRDVRDKGSYDGFSIDKIKWTRRD